MPVAVVHGEFKPPSGPVSTAAFIGPSAPGSGRREEIGSKGGMFVVPVTA